MAGVTWTNTMEGNDYDSAMDKAVEAALVTAGVILERDASQLAPVDTGRLRGSITWATKAKVSGGRDIISKGGVNAGSMLQGDEVRAPTKKWTLHVGSNVEYAPYVEYGIALKQGSQIIATGIRAQPFLRPALHKRKKDIVRDFGKWVAKYLKAGK